MASSASNGWLFYGAFKERKSLSLYLICSFRAKCLAKETAMVKNASVKNLVKILIGAAWLDGKIQPEERQYLQQVAKEKGVAADPEIQPLLNEFRVVQPTKCYEWVREYLGDHPSQEDCQKLLEAISGLIYRDGEVAIEEAKLLTKLQSLNSANETLHPAYSGVLKQIQKIYRRWVDQHS
jgi:hypothetical protein